jgi:ribosomal protein S27AE
MPVFPMQCPRCGSTMNHHGDKTVYHGAGQADPDLGGIVTEMHACPRCGYVTSRPEEAGNVSAPAGAPR